MTFPHTVGALPDYYNHKPSADRSYEFSTRQPLFPFGYGLSYTTFKFDNLKVEPQQIMEEGTAKVSVDVTNTGTREGDEVPQLYVHPRVSSVTQPVMQLKGFERIAFKPGEKRTVSFTVTPEMLSILNIDMHRVVEPGVFELMVGPSSDKTSTVKLTVTGANGDTGKPAPTARVPAGSDAIMVSNFDGGKVAAVYGMWIPASDGMQGGKSNSRLEVVEPGATNTKGAMQVSGEVAAGGQFMFRWSAVLSGRSADAAGKPVEEEHHQFLGEGGWQHVHSSSANRVAQWTERRTSGNDLLCCRSGVEAIHISLLHV